VSKLVGKPKSTERQKREAFRRRDCDGEPVRKIARSYKSPEHDFTPDNRQR
jgi:hypothetical protein